MKFSEKALFIEQAREKTFNVLSQYEGYEKLKSSLESSLMEKEQDSSLRIVFAGQYSSGKSSIISALTGNSEIKIDSNIATDETEDYKWRSVTLTDTPGISAGRADHDAITHQKIQHADVLVYVVTYSLFDNVLIEDFKRLAIDYNYRHKMMLVVNKMYSEEGEYEDLCATYLQNLEAQVGPEILASMPVPFVSSGNALNEDADFHPYGHMSDLENSLEKLIEKNHSLARLEAIAQIIATHIEDDVASRVDGTSSDEQALLQRVERVISHVKREAENSLAQRINDIKSLARMLGSEHAANVGESENLESEINASVERLIGETEAASNQLATTFEELDSELESQLAELNDSNLAERFFISFKTQAIAVGDVDATHNITQETDFEVANRISELLGAGSKQFAIGASGVKAGSGLLSSSGASGSAIHKAVLGVGKSFGTKFQPWQAVNIAKNIGNVAKIAGPIMAALPIAFEIFGAVQEEKQSRQVAEARQKIRGSFQKLADKSTVQLQESAGTFIDNKYGKLLNEISQLRRARIGQAKNLEEGSNKLSEIAQSLRAL